jgi:hypothetical protein
MACFCCSSAIDRRITTESKRTENITQPITDFGLGTWID